MRFKFKNVPAGVNKLMITLDKKINGVFAASLNADYIVIDSPPTSLMVDAEILAEYADVSILVVRQGMASAGSINDTIDVLENGHSEFLGCIYNDVKTGIFSGKRALGLYGGYQYIYEKYGYGKILNIPDRKVPIGSKNYDRS